MIVGVRAHDYGRGTPEQLAQKISEAGWKGAQIAVQKLIEGYNRLDDVTPGIVSEIYEEFSAKGIATPVLGFYVNPAIPTGTCASTRLSSSAAA
jgi:hypothetical protein